MTHSLSVPSMRPPDAALGGETETSTIGVPQRHGKALLGWIQEPDVRPVFHGTSVTSPLNVEDFVEECRARRDARAQTPGAPSSPPAVANLPVSLEPQAATLRATDQFRTFYEPFGAAFVVVPLADLATPQWWIDTEYVETLALMIHADGWLARDGG